jgi:hypothetical protein
MKTRLLIFGIFALTLSVSSCKKKDNKETEMTDKPLTLSPLTTEQQKTSLQDNGIALANKMEEMMNSDEMKSISDFVTPLQNSGEITLSKSFEEFQSGVSKDPQASVDNFYRQLSKAVSEDKTLWGKWDYSPISGKFEKKNSSVDKKATFNFPAKGSKSNNATLTINYVESNVRIPSQPDLMPQSLTVSMVVDSKEFLNFQTTVSYNSDLTPSLLKESLKLGNFNATLNYTSDTKNIEEKFALMYNADVLVKYEFTTSGNYTLYDILSQASQDAYSEFPVVIANTGAMYVQLMNVGVYFKINDVKSLMSKYLLIGADAEYLEKKERGSSIKEIANLLNSNIVAYAYFVDKKEKVADLEFYVGEQTEYDYRWNEITKKYDKIPYTESVLKTRLLMSDKSKQDIEAFVQTGFDGLKDKLNNMTVTEE